MEKRSWRNHLFNPSASRTAQHFYASLLAIVLSVCTFLLLPIDFSLIQYELFQNERVEYNAHIYLKDVNNDGESEKISFKNNYDYDYPNVQIRTLEGIQYDQWNLKGTWPVRFEPVFGDFDNDNYLEGYCISLQNDSILLYGIEFLGNDYLVANDLFIDTTSMNHLNTSDVELKGGLLFDADNDGYKELYLVLYAGFSKYPRNVYRINLKTKEVIRSPLSGSGISHKTIHCDLNKDSFSISGKINAHGNYVQNIPYKDSSSYAMIFNKDLEFTFEPIEFKRYTNNTECIPFHSNYGKGFLIGNLLISDNSKEKDFSLDFYDYNGNLVQDFIIPDIPVQSFFLRQFYYLNNLETFLIFNFHEIYRVHKNMSISKIAEIPDFKSDFRKVLFYDIDRDGSYENIVMDISHEKICILNHNLELLQRLNIPSETSYTASVQIGINRNHKEFIFAQKGNRYYMYQILQNPWHNWKYPLLIAIFLMYFMLFNNLLTLYKKRLLANVEKEKNLLKLQYTSANNQLSPHFILNALNSISGLYISNKTDQAEKSMTSFSRLIRQTLLNADKITLSLAEELDFTRNFLEVQRNRFNHIFDYSITIDERVNPEVPVPRMLIHTFAENAVKHGLVPLGKGGKIDIQAKLHKHKLTIEISDNGIGREASRKLQTRGTGKGLAIVDEIIDLYQKLTNKSIHYQIIDLTTEKDSQTGTRVIIYFS